MLQTNDTVQRSLGGIRSRIALLAVLVFWGAILLWAARTETVRVKMVGEFSGKEFTMALVCPANSQGRIEIGSERVGKLGRVTLSILQGEKVLFKSDREVAKSEIRPMMIDGKAIYAYEIGIVPEKLLRKGQTYQL